MILDYSGKRCGGSAGPRLLPARTVLDLFGTTGVTAAVPSLRNPGWTPRPGGEIRPRPDEQTVVGPLDRDLVAQQLFERLEACDKDLVGQGDRLTKGPGAGRPADPVDVVIGMLGEIVVHHVRHAFDMQSPGRHVGCDQNGGLVQSFRGRRRGYCLAREPSEIPLRELLEAIEGPDLFQRCAFWGNRCEDSNPCLLHAGWREIKPQLTEFLEGLTLACLAQNENGGADAASV